MKCPFCESKQLFVTNSRETKKEMEVWRRRRCGKCNETFSTYERVDLSYLVVIKKSGRRVRYVRAKLYSGIYEAISGIKKIDRGDSGAMAEKITEKVEEIILKRKKKEISTKELREISKGELKKKYPPAYLRYKAYFG